MLHLQTKMDWISGSCINQFGFFLVLVYFYIQGIKSGLATDAGGIFMGVYLLLMVFAIINAIAFAAFIRQLLCMAFQMANVFLIPLIMNALGTDIKTTILMSIIYVIITIAISSTTASIGVLITSIAFACYMHYQHTVIDLDPIFRKQIMILDGRAPQGDYRPLAPEHVKIYKVTREATLKELSAQKDVYGDPKKWEYLYSANMDQLDGPDKRVLAGKKLRVPELPKVDYADYMKITFAYAGAALIAFCWRLLIAKLYTLYMLAMSKSSEKFRSQIDDLKGELDNRNKEYSMLKEEIAMQIVEMNRISGYTKKES